MGIQKMFGYINDEDGGMKGDDDRGLVVSLAPEPRVHRIYKFAPCSGGFLLVLWFFPTVQRQRLHPKPHAHLL